MVWKPKEKKITPEEAIELAKKELTPFWLGSPPLLAAVRSGDAVNVYPLSQAYSQGSWLIFFLDPLTFQGETIFRYASEYFNRYHQHDLNFLFIFESNFQVLGTAVFEKWLNRFKTKVIAAIDPNGLLAAAFRVEAYSEMILINAGKFVLKSTLGDFKAAETEIQNYLRVRDPGLPLLPVYDSSEIAGHTKKINFGFSHFSDPAFVQHSNEHKIGQFRWPAETPKVFDVQLQGSWVQDQNRIVTSDSSAAIRVSRSYSKLGLIAEPMSAFLDLVKIQVEVDGAPPFESFSGKDLIKSDDGQSFIKVEGARLYHVLSNTPENRKVITLSFPTASRVPVALYGLRFSD